MKLGNNNIGSLYLGNNSVNAVYLGTNLVWQNAPIATAATGIGETSFTANWNAYTGAVYYLLDVSTSPTFNTFVYENQVVTSTSYVVIGLTGGTTYYYRVRAVTDVDTDAATFISRVYTAGGALTYTEVTATEQLVLDLKDYGIWTKMKAIYPMVGASAAACAQNLKSSSFTGTFTSGWTFASTGVTPNGTSAYMDTGLIPNNELQLNSTHISGYLRTNNSVSGPILSAENASNYNNGLYIWPGGTGYAPSVRINDNTSTTYTAGADIRGLHIATRTASNVKKMRRNKTEMFSNTASSTNLNADSIYVAKSRNNNNYYTNSIALITIGDGLSDAECNLFYDAQQAFQTTLSRQV